MLTVRQAIDGLVKLAFVTSQRYDGDILSHAINDYPNCAGVTSGLDAADCICQELADSAGLDGLYAAWLSDGTDSPDTRFIKSFSEPYFNTAGKRIADDWTDLTDGSLYNPINRTETNGGVAGKPYSNVDEDGTAKNVSGSCNKWESNSASFDGNLGEKGATTADWSDNGQHTVCSADEPFYCFEQ
jgi:hypothetical protein